MPLISRDLCVTKVKVDNYQEMAQSERNSHSKNRGAKEKKKKKKQA